MVLNDVEVYAIAAAATLYTGYAIISGRLLMPFYSITREMSPVVYWTATSGLVTFTAGLLADLILTRISN